MNFYSRTLQRILELKQDESRERLYQVEHNEYHHDRLQETDIDLIMEVLVNLDLPKTEFAYELYCRTLLAQITHSGFIRYFDNHTYSSDTNPLKLQFIETVGCCPTSCNYQLRPLGIPILILHYCSTNTDNVSYSINLLYSDIERTLSEHRDAIRAYKTDFSNRIRSVLEPLVSPNTPEEIKIEIVKVFNSFEVAF